MQKGEKYWQCPFCHKEAVKVFHKPAHRESKVGRGSGQSSTVSVMVPEKVEVIGKCDNCGMAKNKIQAVIDGKMTAEEAMKPKRKKCTFCGEPFEGPGRLCPQCKKWEN